MANMNIRARLEKVSNDLEAIGKFIAQHHGIPAKDAVFVDNLATDMAVQAATLASMARQERGDRSAGTLPKKVRKALGFSYP